MLHPQTKTTGKNEEQKIEQSKSRTHPKIIVQIQYCNNCEVHSHITRHNQQKYLLFFNNLKKRLSEENITVKRKPVPQNLYKKSPYCAPNVFYLLGSNQMVFYPAVGAFEIFLNDSKIFSKLVTKKWPNTAHILGEIYKATLDIRNIDQRQKITERVGAELKVDVNKDTVLLKMFESSKNRYFRIKKKIDQKEERTKSSMQTERMQRPGTNSFFRKSLNIKIKANSQRNSYSRGEGTLRHQSKDQEENAIVEVGEMKKIYTQRGRSQNGSRNSYRLQIESLNIPNLPKNGKKQGLGFVYLKPVFPQSAASIEHANKIKEKISKKQDESKTKVNDLLIQASKNNQEQSMRQIIANNDNSIVQIVLVSSNEESEHQSQKEKKQVKQEESKLQLSVEQSKPIIEQKQKQELQLSIIPILNIPIIQLGHLDQDQQQKIIQKQKQAILKKMDESQIPLAQEKYNIEQKQLIINQKAKQQHQNSHKLEIEVQSKQDQRQQQTFQQIKQDETAQIQVDLNQKHSQHSQPYDVQDFEQQDQQQNTPQ